MSRIHLTVSLCCAVLFAGCPGTIDDPASFEDNGLGAGAGDPIDAGTQGTRGDAGGGAVADAGGGSGGGGGTQGGDSGGGTAPSCDFEALMQTKCGNSGCHGSPALSTGLDLTSDGLAARLRGKQASGACSDYLLIDTDDPERSALYLITTQNSCGIRMPLGGNLSDAEQTCILQWIENL